jgi:predicted small metal-binding protein
MKPKPNIGRAEMELSRYIVDHAQYRHKLVKISGEWKTQQRISKTGFNL